MNFFKKYIRILISFVLIVVVVKMGLVKLDDVFQSLKNPTIVISGFICLIMQTVVFALRWRTIVNTHLIQSQNRPSNSEYKIPTAIRHNLIGLFFNFFIPSGVGGDLVKAYTVSKEEHITKHNTFSLVTVDRVLGLFSMILFSTIFLFLEYLKGMPENLAYFLHISLGLLSLACFGLITIYNSQKVILKLKPIANQKLIKTFIHFLEHTQMNMKLCLQNKVFFRIISISFLAQTMSISFLYFVAGYQTGQEISLLQFIPLACFAFMSSAVPLTPAGIGVGQAAFYFIFSFINIPIALAVTTGISLMQFFQLLISLPGGYFFITNKQTLKNIIKETP